MSKEQDVVEEEEARSAESSNEEEESRFEDWSHQVGVIYVVSKESRFEEWYYGVFTMALIYEHFFCSVMIL